MEKLLRLKIYVDGGINDTPFPNADDQIAIGAFRYDAKRMGGAPTITASVNYPSCLDNEWTGNVYAEFNGEKYFLKHTPTSSYNNESAMYKHDVELVSARAILDNVLFYDAVVGDPQDEDKPVSNSTKFVFFGKIDEFAERLNASLQYAKLQKVDDSGNYVSGYRVLVDQGITSEAMLVSFEDQFFSNAIQESYNTYKVPYYFVGKEIHFGNSGGAIATEFSYGVDDALLSITKSNANNKVVNRVTGRGSSENLPYYYPNNSPKGDVDLSVNSSATLRITDREKFASEVGVNDVITYNKGTASSPYSYYYKYEDGVRHNYTGTPIQVSLVNDKPQNIWIGVTFTVENEGEFEVDGSFAVSLGYDKGFSDFIKSAQLKNRHGSKTLSVEDGVVSCGVLDAGSHTILMGFSFPYLGLSEYTVAPSVAVSSLGAWKDAKGKNTSLRDIGLSIVSGSPTVGDTIRQTVGEYITPSTVLLPQKYRTSKGTERFYNATNGIYKDENGEDIVFANPFVEGQPKEHIITVEDIKPTIKGTKVLQPNGSAGVGYTLNIDMFSEFAYDLDDNDETYIDEEDGNTYFKHPYFYGKLRVMDFNIFECANENQSMTISFTSGDCGACNFEIGATEDYPQMNPVQVDESGNLIYKDGRVWCGLEGVEGQAVTEFQDRQQDTSKYEVWVALKKEEETYGMLMPNGNIRPKACTSATLNDGDTFVILGINLPQSYIDNAEKKLEAEIIKYMKDNNVEKFNFSINFSRIYFEENPNVLELLNENASLFIWYNGVRYELYVSSMSYQMGEGEVLPDIRVELVGTLAVSQNAIQNAIGEVKAQMGQALANLDVLTAVTPYFIRKDQDDEVRGRVNFTKGLKFGEGGKVEVLDNNSAKLTIEYLEVTKKASFTSLEIQEKTHVGGQMLVTPAAINCGEVEEFDNFYRCYFQTQGVDGDEIFNQFAVGDQAICQTYNAWGSKYYWRLVAGVGEDYIDLSKIECDEDSDEPSTGDKIIQLGNQVDTSRQNAIVIAAYGDGSPYIIQYKGIDAFEIPDNKIVTKLSSTENIFTGKVHMELGSDGVENLNLEIGAQNMLRNSGFTGDYLSSPLVDEDVLDSATELFSSPLDYWKNEGASVQNSSESQSGKEVVIADGSIEQELYQRVVSGESYVLSFKAKGTSLTYRVGGTAKAIELADDWVRYVEKFVASESGAMFTIDSANCVMCDLQLERGTMATAWGNSPFDNSSDRTYYQSLKYLQDAFEGATDVVGGLVLTEQVRVGDYDKENKEWVKENGGISGIYEDDNDVAFWAGGNFEKAINAVMKYQDNPSYQPTEEELASMANFVVTHGGRTILNDAIVRGKVYASGGEFTGNVHFGPNSDGLSNIQEWKELEEEVGGASRLNLLADSAEIIIPITDGNYNYKIVGLPILVKNGDTFTFKAELAEALAGDFTEFSVTVYDPTITTQYADNIKVNVGTNVASTITINKNNPTGNRALLLIYAGVWGDTANKSLRLTNFSLVKGSVPMATWQDYQGDNGLVNLINIETANSLTISEKNLSVAKIKVSGGEKYTFIAKRAEFLSGEKLNGFSIGIRNTATNTWLNTTGATVVTYGSYTYATLTVYADTAANTDGELWIYSGETPTNFQSTTIRLTNPSLVKGSRPMMVWKENTDYLFNAFANGSTNISGGLVMTQATMVRDESGKVRGMFNGSDYAKDANYGKIMIALGSDGSSELAMQKAITRMYENGTIVIDSPSTPYKLTISEAGISTVSEKSHGWMGNCAGAPIVGVGEGGVSACPDESFKAAICGSSAQDGAAFLATQGMFFGLRPRTRVSTGGDLSNTDHTIVVSQASNAAFTLPSQSSTMLHTGQIYQIIKKNSAGTITIYGNGKNIFNLSTGESSTEATITNRGVTRILYDGTEWLIMD